ncbi:MAG: alpha/beta fold hydrolase [Kofleriaceae bacterium]
MDEAPLELPGDDRGVVVVHGFTSSPQSIAPLARALAARGHTVAAPLLPGHGTSASELAATTRDAWRGAVEAAVDALRARCRVVAVVGQSLGGLLALELAARRPDVAAVASLAAPLWLDGLGGRAARWTGPGGLLRGRVRALPKLGGADVRDAEAKAADSSYRLIPTAALAELCALMPEVEAALPAIRQPVLVVHSVADHTAPVGSAARIQGLVPQARLRLLEHSFHLLAVDVDREVVAAEVGDFLAAHLGPG